MEGEGDWAEGILGDSQVQSTSVGPREKLCGLEPSLWLMTSVNVPPHIQSTWLPKHREWGASS